MLPEVAKGIGEGKRLLPLLAPFRCDFLSRFSRGDLSELSMSESHLRDLYPADEEPLE
jgi:hypothetical protein